MPNHELLNRGKVLLASGTGNLRSHRIAMVQATQSRQRSNRASAPWVDSNWATGWRVLGQPQMRSILMVQIYKQMPIIPNRDSSVMRGIRGLDGPSGFTEHWSRVDDRCIAAVSRKTRKPRSSRSRSRCLNQISVAECAAERSP